MQYNKTKSNIRSRMIYTALWLLPVSKRGNNELRTKLRNFRERQFQVNEKQETKEAI